MRTYRYAFDSANRIVDAASLPDDRAALDKSYLCVGCGRSLVAKIKAFKKAKHFAHSVDHQGSCSPETYLHKLGKEVFKETFEACRAQGLPFTIELPCPRHCFRFAKLGSICANTIGYERFDLADIYDHVLMETHDGSFVPDLLLTKRAGTKRPVYIEIVVTHFATDQKRASGRRIIEIPISSEDDLEKIRRHHLSSTDAQFINFAPKPKKISDSDCTCALEKGSVFRVYRNGSHKMSSLTLFEVEHFLAKEEPGRIWSSMQHFWGGGSSAYVAYVEQAHSEGVPIRNCFVCQLSTRNWRVAPPVFCRCFSKPCNSTAAVDCHYFSPKPRNQKPDRFSIRPGETNCS
jgi:hypothetical protein